MSSELRVGDWIGDRFEIFDVHEGGMSLVYVVHDRLGKAGPSVVALKTLREELLGNRVRRSRFANECRLWVQLGHHANIVQAYAVEILEGRPFVMIELVQGGDLVRWIGTPRLDLRQALKFGVQFCLGMEHASRQGLSCHRDIKPGNLLITEDGTLKITDFGLARVCEEMIAVRPELPDGSIPLSEGQGPPPRIIWTDPRDREEAVRADGDETGGFEPATSALADPQLRSRVDGPEARVPPRIVTVAPTPSRAPIALPSTAARDPSDWMAPEADFNPRLTGIGVRLGTGAYMAPEQSRDASSVDIRADIYGFGVVLYEMIAGHLPFKGKSFSRLQRQHARETPPSLIGVIPARYAKFAGDIDQVVQKCLVKDPEGRYRTIVDLRQAIQKLSRRIGAR